MQSKYTTQLTDSTRDEIDTISIESFFAISEDSILYEKVEKYLYDSLFLLPRFDRHIHSTIRLIKLARTWVDASSYQKEGFSLHLSAVRSNRNEGFRDTPKGQFTFPHHIKADLLGCCKRTMERSNMFWERNGCILPAVRKRVSFNKTVNFYHKEKMLQELRIVGDELFISHIEDDGSKRFLSLNDYIKELVSEIEIMVKEAKNNLEKKSQIERGCRPNCTENICVNNSLEIQKNRYQISKKDDYIRKYLQRGISLPYLGAHIYFKKDEIERLLWYTRDQILHAIEVLQSMSEDKLEALKSPAAYLISCCKNSYNQDFSWKKKKYTFTRTQEPVNTYKKEEIKYVYTLAD